MASLADRLKLSARALLDPGWLEQWPRLVRPAQFLLVSLLAYEVANLTLLILGPQSLDAPSKASVPVHSRNAGLSAEELRYLLAQDPFAGAAGAGKTATSASPAARSRLRVELMGTSVGEEPDSYAILLVPELKPQEEVYRLGEQLTPGVSLRRIERDRVVLLDHEQEQTVMLEERGSAAPGQGTPAPARTLSRAQVNAQKQDPARFIRSIELQPAAQGLQVTRLQQGSLLQRAGLAQGDVILAVNGQPVRSMGDLAAVYGGMEEASDIEVQVLRGGAAMTLSVAIR
jgi:general secretion pathway protein C